MYSSTNYDKQLVAIEDLNDDLCGQIVWWSLCGFIDHDKMIKAWNAAELPTELCPVLPENGTALRYAMHKISTGNIRARKVRNAWAVVTEEIDGKNYKTQQDWTVTLEKNGELSFDWVSQRALDPQDRALELHIKSKYNQFRTNFSAQTISGWLTNPSGGLLRHLDATTMRDKGALYFIPKNRMTLWNKIVGILRAHSNHVVHNIPALYTDEVVGSVMHAVQRELANTIDEVDAAFNDKDLGERGLQTQLDKLAEARSKAKRYEKLLGAQVEELGDKGLELDAQIGEAILAKRAEKDKADNLRKGAAA